MASAAVNRPTNVKQKEQDVNAKLQLYGIYSAFANGKVPSNKQIDVALNSTLASSPLTNPPAKLSSEGKLLVSDLRSAIEQAKNLLLTKNEGNLLQDFIWETQQLGAGSATAPNLPVDKSTAQQHGNEALEGLRTLGTLLITNGQFRKLLSDAVTLFRDMAGDAAQNAATRINPSEDKLSQIDRPADDNTWHEAPDLSKESLKSQVKSTVNKNKPLDQTDLKSAANDAAGATHPSGARDPADVARLEAESRQDGTTAGLDREAAAGAGAGTLKERASENTPDATKDRLRDAYGSSKEYLQKKMPADRRDQTIWRLKKMVVEIQGHPDYQRAIETLLRLAETYGGHAQTVGQQSTGAVKGVHDDNHLTKAEADLRTLIERFANYTSSDDLFDSINTIYRDADADPQLRGWFKKTDTYIRKCLQTQGYIMQDACNEDGRALQDEGRFLLRDRYRTHTDRILDEIKFFGNQFDADAQNKKFGETMQKLFNDLGNDENGKPVFKKHLVKDLSGIILPGIFENVRYVPIPRIEYSDSMMDAIVENLVIESDNLMPNIFELGSDNYFRWGRKSLSNKNQNKIMLSVSGVQMDLRDVSYYINKKQGFPSVKDRGVADIFMGGTGFSFKVKMSTADSKDRAHFFKVESVDVDVKNLNIKLKQSNHKLLFGLFKPLLFKVVRPAIQKVLEKQIKDSVHQFDGFAYEIHQEAERAKKQIKNDPESAPNVYQRYYEAAQKRMLEGKQKAQAVASDKKVNVAVTQHDSIFKDIKLPGGISSKATEYKELAAKGEKWESPVFGIGSAKESTNIPKATAVTKKSHSTASSTLRGSQTNGTAGFSNQVDQAFNQDGTVGKTSGAGYGTNATSGTTGTTGTSGIPGTTGTTLGQNNPVLSGDAPFVNAQ
ncbi:MAG: Mitochondrial distribution and morphology protein 10 [Chaenotheca gracillima]|nr:MAG: Mitochondrial distribution and morphology protein 10 [Chaenotheca gracillima]